MLCVEAPDPVISEPDDVLVRIEAFPINPADLLAMQGFYPRSDPRSLTLGTEATGVVEAVGSTVSGIRPGDSVILLSLDNWSEKKIVKAHQVIPILSDIDLLQRACLKVNPATAALILRLFVDLNPGDWLLQNAAGSAVGRAMIQIARRRGLRTASVVRRESAIDDLIRLGADVVLIDGDDLASRVAAATNGAEIRLAADAVAGMATNRLCSCLASRGSLVIYGALSGEPLTVNPGMMVFQDISLRSFWLTRYLATADQTGITDLYREIERFVSEGQIVAQIDSVHDAGAIRDAVRRAGSADVAGKVVVTFS